MVKKAAAPTGFKSGYVMLLGLPNVGKSTLLNALLGEELAIVTPKPQTTRNRILGILTRPDAQVIFLDTPGIVESERGLNLFLKREVQRALADADAIVLVVEAAGAPAVSERSLIERLVGMGKPVILAMNKIDKMRHDDLLPAIDTYRTLMNFAAVVPICARRADGVDALLAETVRALPEGPLYYPAEQMTDVTERFVVGEMIREQVFLQTRQEIPYSAAVLVEYFEDRESIVRIAANLVVERDSQKGIIIGKGGAMLKAIGTKARAKIETFLGKQVFLDLTVKVKKDWTRSESTLREMGYD